MLAERAREDLRAMNVLSLQFGRIAPFGPDGIPSGFVKVPTLDRTEVRYLGLVGDAQADLQLHGGADKAVYGYAASHYGEWLADFPEHEALLKPGGFGENLTITGMDERQICVGDVHRIGTTILQVCQPRVPCYKLALRFADNRMPRAMVRSGRAGWYYRVLKEGHLQVGDDLEVLERPHPNFPLPKLVEIVNYGRAGLSDLRTMATMPGLAVPLRMLAEHTLQGLEAAKA
jgi:MOSC domain-containing protein YiiM